MYREDKIHDESMKEAVGVFEGIKKQDLSIVPVIVYARDFKTERGFAYCMDMCGKYFKDSDDVIVRYAKPEDKETGEVSVNFQVLKSKTKMFLNWFRKQTETLYFVCTSVREIKECIKFFNSLGVKGDDGESILVFADEMKADFNPDESKIYVAIMMFDNVPTLSWSQVGKFYECDHNFSDIKETIENVLKH